MSIDINQLMAELKNPDISLYRTAVILDMLKDAGMRQNALAEAMGKNKSWVSRLITTYRNATPVLRAAWMAGTMPWEAVKALAPRPKEEQTAAVIDPTPPAPPVVVVPANRQADELLASLKRYVAARKKLSQYMQGVYDALLYARGDKVTGFSPDWARVQRIAKRLERR